MKGHDVLIRVDTDDRVLDSGIVIPQGEKNRETPMYGTIVRTGKGGKMDRGGHVPMTLVPGQEVIFTRYGGHDLDDNDGTSYRIIPQFNVWATVEGGVITPHGNRVKLVLSESDGKTEWGFIIPEKNDERDLARADVVAAGLGTYNDKTGVLVPQEVRPGDTVMFLRYAGLNVLEGSDPYRLVGPNDIYAVVE